MKTFSSVGRNDKEKEAERENQTNSDGSRAPALPGVLGSASEHITRQPQYPDVSFIGPRHPRVGVRNLFSSEASACAVT